MKLVQTIGYLTPQFTEIVHNAIDRRQFADVTTPGADIEFSVTHGLGFVPMGFLVASQDKAGSFYNSTTAWTTEKIFLKCSAATATLRILIF